MKSTPKTTGEYQNFENALRHVVQVPRAEIQAKLEAEKKAKEKKKKSGNRSSNQKTAE
jgi:hypothetical protein